MFDNTYDLASNTGDCRVARVTKAVINKVGLAGGSMLGKVDL